MEWLDTAKRQLNLDQRRPLLTKRCVDSICFIHALETRERIVSTLISVPIVPTLSPRDLFIHVNQRDEHVEDGVHYDDVVVNADHCADRHHSPSDS